MEEEAWVWPQKRERPGEVLTARKRRLPALGWKGFWAWPPAHAQDAGKRASQLS